MKTILKGTLEHNGNAMKSPTGMANGDICASKKRSQGFGENVRNSTSKNATVIWDHVGYLVVDPHVLTAASEAIGKQLACSNDFVEQSKALHPLSRLECITCA